MVRNAFATLLFKSLSLVVFMAVVPSQLWPQTEAASHLVILDLTSSGDDSFNSVFTFPGDSTAAVELRPTLANLRNETTGRALASVRMHASRSVGRFVSQKGDRVEIFAFHPIGTIPLITYEEVPRDSQLTTDLGVLVQLVPLLAAGAGPADFAFTKKTLILAHQRGTLTVSAALGAENSNSRPSTQSDTTNAAIAPAAGSPGGPAAMPPTGSQNSDDGLGTPPPPTGGPSTGGTSGAASNPATSSSGTTLSSTIVTGPQEHWFLSANVTVNRIEQLKYNDETNSLETTEKPNQFLIGIDYFFGDLATEGANGPVAKVLLEASKTPADSLGIGVGWRFEALRRGGFELSAFSPFVGLLRVRNDEVVDGSVERKGDEEYKLVGGLSFNLDKALDWVQGAGQ